MNVLQIWATVQNKLHALILKAVLAVCVTLDTLEMALIAARLMNVPMITVVMRMQNVLTRWGPIPVCVYLDTLGME
jgi:hypothetical protein